MTDLEMTRLAAEAMGWATKIIHPHGIYAQQHPDHDWHNYTPLTDDAQAMALVKKFRLDIESRFGFPDEKATLWDVRGTCHGWERTMDNDLNRAIVECVAKMQAARRA